MERKRRTRRTAPAARADRPPWKVPARTYDDFTPEAGASAVGFVWNLICPSVQWVERHSANPLTFLLQKCKACAPQKRRANLSGLPAATAAPSRGHLRVHAGQLRRVSEHTRAAVARGCVSTLRWTGGNECKFSNSSCPRAGFPESHFRMQCPPKAGKSLPLKADGFPLHFAAGALARQARRGPVR